MSKLKLLFNNLKRNKFYKCFIIITTLAVVIINLYSFFYIDDICGAGDFLTINLRALKYLSVLFIFFSYECFLKINFCKETIQVCKKSVISVYKAQICLFELYIILLIAAESIFGIIYIAIANQIDPVIILNTILVIVCYYFLVLTASVFIGLMLSFIKKRAFAYTLMLLFAISVTGLVQKASDLLFDRIGKDFSKLFEFFFIIPHSLEFEVTFQTGVIFDVNKISLLLFYIVLAVVIVVLVSCKQKKEKVWKSAVCFVLCACLLAGYFMPVSNPKYDESSSSFNQDASYYRFYKDYVKEEAAEFGVKQYDLKLSAYLNLKADVKVFVDKHNLDEYKFTLYHKYKVKNVTNQKGERLDFKQESDYLTVKASGETEYLNISYYGGSTPYYSSYSGINLPGNFYFYPVAGFHKMFINMYGFVCRELPDETVFNVELDYPKAVYSNLEETEENKFSGTAKSLTLMSGYYKMEKIEDTAVYYPYMSNRIKVSDLYEYLEPFLKDNRNIKKMFFIPLVYSSQFAGIRMYDDYMFLWETFDVDQAAFESKIDYTKKDLFILTRNYYDPETDAEHLKQLEENASEEEKEQIAVLKSLFASENREEAAEDIVNYLTDGKDMRSPTVFIKELGEKYA